MAASEPRPKRTRPAPPNKSRSSQNIPKTEIIINVYDLLPPGRLSSCLWTIGSALLHSGVVINNREYAYGGHDRRNLTGVYSTRPRLEPPGGTFRCSILHGFTFRNEKEIEAILKQLADEFQGCSYNLLTNNCNHYTSALCMRLTGKPAPTWLNRAASIGVALPCFVPKEWITPPDYETADGDLLEDDAETEEEDERSSMLHRERQKRYDEARSRTWQIASLDDHTEDNFLSHHDPGRGTAGVSRWTQSSAQTSAPRLVDTNGRTLPAAERAPLPRK